MAENNALLNWGSFKYYDEKLDEIIDGINNNISITANTISNPNLLINSNFKINKRRSSGTITQTGYFVDRWQLVSGSVTINEDDSSIILNGKIKQIVETKVLDATTASSSAGIAQYDDETKTFTITASGETISWAKLEKGETATQYTPPVYADELEKCQRYYMELNQHNTGRPVIGFGSAHTATRVSIMVNLPTAMRSTPTVKMDGSWAVRTEIEGSTTVISLNDTTVTSYVTLNSLNCVVLAFNSPTAIFEVGKTYFLQGNKASDENVYPSLQLDAELV